MGIEGSEDTILWDLADVEIQGRDGKGNKFTKGTYARLLHRQDRCTCTL